MTQDTVHNGPDFFKMSNSQKNVVQFWIILNETMLFSLVYKASRKDLEVLSTIR